jgi:hypothetical protein
MARRQKSLSAKDRRRIEAKKQANRQRRLDAEWRDYWRRVIQPVLDNVDAPMEDDIRSYGPAQPGSTADRRQRGALPAREV